MMREIHLLNKLKVNQQRGSKPRCHILTHGNKCEVAKRLTDLASPHAYISEIDTWMPIGFDNIEEAELHAHLLPQEICSELQSWWLKVPHPRAKTPNWDIASTCTINGKSGLLLIEAKAYDKELDPKGKQIKSYNNKNNEIINEDNSIKNHKRIGNAIKEANVCLNGISVGWDLSRDSHYQLANRFAWSWKIASLGIPVLLIYLGFLGADEMSDKGISFKDNNHWTDIVLKYAEGIVPSNAWEQEFDVNGTIMRATIRSVNVGLSIK